MRIDEIEARKAEIKSVLKSNQEFDVDALTEEVRSLDAEAAEIRAQAEKEAELRNMVASDEVATNIIETFEEKEERKMFEVNSVEYRNAWLKNLQGQELTVEERGGYTQAGTNAVPTMVSDKFFEKMKKLAPMLSEITLLRAAGNVQFVVEGTRNTVSKHTELAEISVAGDSTVSVSLAAFEFYKVIAISESARMMAIDAFEGWLIDMLAGDIARGIENYILNDVTNGVAACVFTTNTNQILNTATTGYTYKNVIDLIALLPAGYDAEAKFLTNKATLYGKIANILDGQNRPIFVESPEAGLQGRIMGYPVVVSDYVATTNNGLYLCKWTDVVGNLSQDINVITYPDYDHGAVKYRGGAFFDSKVAKGDGIVRLVSTTA